MGLVVGLLVGLALALGVALYITKAPVPFINKVPQRTPEQDNAEAERNRTWDPNAPLGGRLARPGTAASGVVAAASAASAAAATTTPAMPAAPQGPPAAAPAPPPAAQPTTAAAPAARPAPRDPAAILSGAPAVDPFIYFVQAGAYTRSEDAEQQRARLALLGLVAKVSEREQAGRTVYRVRLGPYPTRDEADGQLVKLQEQSVEAQIVRVEKP